MENTINQIISDIIKNSGKTLTAYSKYIGIAQTSLRDVVKGAESKFSTLNKIINASPIISSDWLLTGKGEMMAKDSTTDKHLIPLYKNEAAAGFGNSDFCIEEKDIEGRYKIKELEFSSFMLHVRGDSMAPKYKNGDIIAVREVKDKRNLQWGKVHLINSVYDGLLIKRIYEDGDNVIAVSDNVTYKPFVIRKEDIKGYGIVIGCINLENY